MGGNRGDCHEALYENMLKIGYFRQCIQNLLRQKSGLACFPAHIDLQKHILDDALFGGFLLDGLCQRQPVQTLDFYVSCGVKDVMPAYELNAPVEVPVMYCKHCIKYSLGGAVRVATGILIKSHSILWQAMAVVSDSRSIARIA